MKFLRNPFKKGSTEASRGAKAIRQEKIEQYYKKKGAKQHDNEKKPEEAEGREPAKEETSRPEEQPANNSNSNNASAPTPNSRSKSPSPPPPKQEDGSLANADKAPSLDDQDDDHEPTGSNSKPSTPVPVLEEKKSEHGEPETIAPPRLSESKAHDESPKSYNNSNSHHHHHQDNKPDAPADAASTTSSAAPTPTSAATTPKKPVVEPRDPPPHSTPDVSFCGCF